MAQTVADSLREKIRKAEKDGKMAKARLLRKQLKKELERNKNKKAADSGNVRTLSQPGSGSAAKRQSGSGKSTFALLRDRGRDARKDEDK